MRRFSLVFVQTILFLGMQPFISANALNINDPAAGNSSFGLGKSVYIGRLLDGYHIKKKLTDIESKDIGNFRLQCVNFISADNEQSVKRLKEKFLGEQVIISGTEHSVDTLELQKINRNTILDQFQIPFVSAFDLTETKPVVFYTMDAPEKIEWDKPLLFRLVLRNPFNTIMNLEIRLNFIGLEYQPFKTKLNLGQLQSKELIVALNRDFAQAPPNTGNLDKEIVLNIEGGVDPFFLEGRGEKFVVCFDDSFIYSGKTGLLIKNSRESNGLTQKE